MPHLPQHNLIELPQRIQLLAYKLQSGFGNCCVVHGLKGSGKTNFVTQFVQAQKQHYAYTLWCNGANGLAQSLQQNTALHNWLGLDQNVFDLLPQALEKLALQQGQGLLVIDNANSVINKELLYALSRLQDCSVILVSNQWVEGVKNFSFDPFTAQECKALFEKTAGFAINSATPLQQQALGNPLAINMLASYCHQHKKSLPTALSFMAYSKYVQKPFDAQNATNGALKAFLTELLRHFNLNAQEQAVLEALCTLPNTSIHKSVLCQIMGLDQNKLEPTLLGLMAKGIVSGSANTIYCSTIVQKAWLGVQMAQAGRLEALAKNLIKLTEAETADQALKNYKWLAYVKPFVEKCQGHIGPALIPLLFNADNLCFRKAQYEAGHGYMGLAMQLAKQHLEPGHEQYVLTLYHYGTSLNKTGHLQQAKEQLLLIYNNPVWLQKLTKTKQLSFYASLTSVYYELGLIEDSNLILDVGLQKAEEWQIDAPIVNELRHTYALKISAQGQHEEAIALMQQILEKEKGWYGEEHITVSYRYCKLGVVYRNAGRYAEAVECLNKSVATNVKLLGQYHTFTGYHYHTRGTVHKASGNYVKALQDFEMAYNIRTKLLGKDHFRTQRTHKLLMELRAQQ